MNNPLDIPDHWQIVGHDQVVNLPTENQGIIITGLGGQDGLLRYCVIIVTRSNLEKKPNLIQEVQGMFSTLFDKDTAILEELVIKSDYIQLQILISMDISVDDTVMQLIEKINDNEKRLFAHYFTTNKNIPIDIEINDYVQKVNELFQNSTTTNTDMRVASIFGKKDPGLIPTVSKRSLKIYCEYLSHNLDMPLKAKFEGQDAVLLEVADTDVVDDLDFHGLLANVRVGRKILTIPLVEIDLTNSNKSKEVVEDYQYWFENFR